MPNLSLSGRLKLFFSLLRKRNFWLILITDVILIIAAHYCAYLLRFAGNPNKHYMLQFRNALPLLLLVKVPIFYLCGLYRGMWRYTSLNDLLNLTRATVISFLLLVTALLFIHRFQGYSRSVFILDAILTFLYISSHRLIIRFFYQRNPGSRALTSNRPADKKRRLLLVGAGDAAEQIIRETKSNPVLPYDIIGLVDDNPAKVGLKIHNIPVIGLIEDLVEHCERFSIEEILIAISAIRGKEMRRINELCRASGRAYKILPGLGELIDGRASIRMMREISYTDLLGRAEVRLDQQEIGSFLTDKTILVTGAGGSIGSELCRQIVRFQPAQLILLDAGEENLYTIQMELEHEFDFRGGRTVLGRIQDFGLLNTVFARYRPSIVFHAAAYKHVPLVELNPWEGVVNNIVGTQCLVEAAILHQVERFVLVSSDKAVRPTNVMGASKRLAELIVMACTKEKWDGTLTQATKPKKLPDGTHDTTFLAVRFGNVLGSSGSVVPLFKRQIELGGPVTVTDKRITRYFMSIEEAAKLILQAGAMGRGGEIFILKMGEPIKIDKLARDLIRLSGREPDTEIEIRHIGLRPGEKLYEELITEGEGIVPTEHEKIMVLRGNGFDYTNIRTQIERLSSKAAAFDEAGIKQILKEMIPEYTPW